MNAMIDREVRDEKAVKIAIGRIQNGEYTIVHKDPAEQAREEEAFLNRNKDQELDRYALLYERHNEDGSDADEEDELIDEAEDISDEE